MKVLVRGERSSVMGVFLMTRPASWKMSKSYVHDNENLWRGNMIVLAVFMILIIGLLGLFRRPSLYWWSAGSTWSEVLLGAWSRSSLQKTS